MYVVRDTALFARATIWLNGKAGCMGFSEFFGSVLVNFIGDWFVCFHQPAGSDDASKNSDV